MDDTADYKANSGRGDFMTDADTKSPPSDRRSFLKIGAGFAVGAVVAGVGVAAYESSVIGSNNSSSSSAVSSLNSELAATQSQLASTQSALGSAQSSLTAVSSQNASLSSQLTATQQSLTSANAQVSTLQSQASSLQISLDTVSAYQTLGADEVSLLQAITSTIIPTDSNGPGANTAGVLYFIDNQLAGKYGWCGQMYMQGPFLPSGVSSAVTVGGVTYSGGTMAAVLDGGQRYQYDMNLRSYWHDGLLAVESYSNSAYGANFEDLSAANQVDVLTDMYNNKPTNFSSILPQDFFYELFFMTWCGFLMDPMYGGNKNMVGWLLTGFNGTNQGNFYGEGYTTKQIMLMTTPPVLKPASLGQFQKGSP
jgi:hypothetical protein